MDRRTYTRCTCTLCSTGRDSDAKDTTFGIRKITYEMPGSDNLTISVNGVPVFIRGGDWGLDEAMKRIPRERLDAEIRLHQMAHLNMIRNWVGQSTSEDFYELCDKYGILVWDEFFQPNPKRRTESGRSANLSRQCARQDASFPESPVDCVVVRAQRGLPTTGDRERTAQDAAGIGSSATLPAKLDCRPRCGVAWTVFLERTEAFYVFDAPFKTETGSVSVPTLESIHAMMPQKDWETINNDWAQHDLAKGAQHGDTYPYVLAGRYGRVVNLADFVRKAQMMNYEAFRAMYEGRNAKLFHPDTGVLTWMSNPAHPSFVWQLYDYDLEPNSSLFAVESASEPVHIQMNEAKDAGGHQ